MLGACEVRGRDPAGGTVNMTKQLQIEEIKKLSEKVVAQVFDRAILDQQTMQDNALAVEILGLFKAQLLRLERVDWGNLELAFEMHTLKGAAAVVGALEIEALAENWKRQGGSLEHKFKAAFGRFLAAAA